MADQCIVPNPDISGIGVRIATYIQNILCFAPVVVHLWDGRISSTEITKIKNQSISMLTVAFAILISTIIQAKTNVQLITSHHAAVILDLSWMNNTSTFIWFILYVHHKTKRNTIPAFWTLWTLWTNRLLFPLKDLMESHNHNDDGTPPPTFFKRIQRLLFRAPVLTLGSIHLTLMGSIGMWLWRDPSKFGRHIPCDPFLVIAGVPVKFSSRRLQNFSWVLYLFLLIPGVNLVPGFLFFLLLHILYNVFRKNCHPTPPPRDITYPDFLVFGIACLFIINVIFIVDIELTLRNNQEFRSTEENAWGFGQVLAMLLLAAPSLEFIRACVPNRSSPSSSVQSSGANIRLDETSIHSNMTATSWVDVGHRPRRQSI